ncbi:DinB family protein [Kribbella qitaiheensis]|uniref:DinB family protein n=1 Tax=Kribbella qitaiheensis TaxID=1544730 RepID=A0A7G6X085_9ACTN|nr:DinB family protein [Kribbella qitaiheensis]QNE19650.1 DinB family protein [Kribbella qitaiheensis]
MTVVKRPPLTSDERTQLTGWLDLQRSFVRMKCEDLNETDAHRSLLPTSPLMTMAGLVAHLRWNEYSWFQLNLLGVPDTGQTPWTEDGHPDVEMAVDDVPIAQLLDEYDAECARSNAAIADLSLDAVEQGLYAVKGEAASLRYILCHMIEETARHLGHLDIIRELLDGSTSYDRLSPEQPA